MAWPRGLKAARQIAEPVPIAGGRIAAPATIAATTALSAAKLSCANRTAAGISAGIMPGFTPRNLLQLHDFVVLRGDPFIAAVDPFKEF